MTSELIAEQDRINRELAERFPDRKSYVLPTRFGNTIRAFEQYPMVVYKCDTIEGWGRLLAVVPKEYRALIDSAKAQTDFWLNFCCLSCFIFLFYITQAIRIGCFRSPWIAVLAVGMAYITYGGAISAAKEWGSLFKSAFDVFLPALQDKLHFSPPTSKTSEQQMWNKFSQVIIYRDPSVLPPRVGQQSDNKLKEPENEEPENEEPETGSLDQTSTQIESSNAIT